MVTETDVFWNKIPLEDMSPEEWESLCDGCGRCCLHKLEDMDTGLFFYTNVACRLLNTHACRCTNYSQRRQIVPDCEVLSVHNDAQFEWLPKTCAYRRLLHGLPLEWWHPLVSGDPETVHRAGISVRDRTVPEKDIPKEKLEEHIIHWIDF